MPDQDAMTKLRTGQYKSYSPGQLMEMRKKLKFESFKPGQYDPAVPEESEDERGDLAYAYQTGVPEC